MGLEGPCGCAAGVGHQHGGLHFHKPAPVQEPADGAEDAGTLDEGVLDLRVGNQVHIPLPVTGVGIGQAVEFFGKGLQVFGQQGDLLRVDGDLTRLGFEDGPPDADHIPNIVFFETGVGILADAVPGDIGLDGAAQILHMAKRGFPHHPFGHHPPGNRNLCVFQGAKIVLDVGAVMGHVVFGDGKGVLALRLQGRQLVPPDLQQLGKVLL